jgi:hypothetical protein
MPDNRLENKIRKHAGEIFGRDTELPSGHRGRFEERLKMLHASRRTGNCRERRNGLRIRLKKRSIASVAVAAAVVAGFVFLPDPSAGIRPDPELADVWNYYRMQLEEQIDATKELIRHVDEAHREELLADIEQIENEPVPKVQLTDDEYIVLIADVYTGKIETLQNLQEIIRKNI